jgi:hypothetical protein
MKTLNLSLDEEKKRIDEEIREMKKHPIDYSDIGPLSESERRTMRLVNEEYLKSLPPAVLNEMARRRLNEAQSAGHRRRDAT